MVMKRQDSEAHIYYVIFNLQLANPIPVMSGK